MAAKNLKIQEMVQCPKRGQAPVSDCYGCKQNEHVWSSNVACNALVGEERHAARRQQNRDIRDKARRTPRQQLTQDWNGLVEFGKVFTGPVNPSMRAPPKKKKSGGRLFGLFG